MSYGILDILLQKIPRPMKPIHPDDLELELTNQNAAPSNQTTVARSESSNDRDEQDTREQANQPAERDARPQQASQSAAAALDPRTLYERQVSRWKRQYKEWEKAEHGLAAIWREMEQTVARRHLRRLTSQSDFAIERYSKLKAKMEPSKEDLISRVIARYNRLLLKPANQNVDMWLGEWEDVMSECNRLGMTNLTGEDGTRTFLTALRRLDQMYAEIRLNELRKDRSLDVFDEIHYFQKRWRSLNQKEQKSAFTTFKGQSPNQQNSDSTNQNHGNEQPKRGPEDCPCGDKHRFDKCPYLIESMRPNGWRPNADIMERFERLKQNPKLQNAMELAIRRANQNQEAAPGAIMSIIGSNSVAFSLGGNKYALRDSWIVDSGADIHVCNN
jgi:hypothetical protein